MRIEFLKRLIIEFPNFMELGSAVSHYHYLLGEGYSELDSEELTLNNSFRNL
jgi:hypothetical protein